MVVSLDLELAWGQFDVLPLATLEHKSSQKRKHMPPAAGVLRPLRHPGDLAVVGHLMLERCVRNRHGEAHLDLFPRASYFQVPSRLVLL